MRIIPLEIIRNLQVRFRQSSNRRKRFVFAIAAFVVSLLLSLLVAEFELRLLGYERLTVRTWQGKVEPGGKYWATDPVLGYRNIPGEFTIWFPDDHRWRMTHLPNGNRVTRRSEAYHEPVNNENQKESIWIFGCSYIHGWCVNDEETLPWLLQERLPDYNIENLAVCGDGTLQFLLRLREALKSTTKIPKVVVLAHASFHDERNTLEWQYRKAAYEYAAIGERNKPFARLGRDGTLKIEYDTGAGWIFNLMKISAVANLLAEKLNSSYDRFYLQSERVSDALIAMFSEECVSRDIMFVLAGISNDLRTNQVLWSRSDNMPTVDISVDLQRPGFFVPRDGHPNVRANSVSTAKLVEFLKSRVLDD